MAGRVPLVGQYWLTVMAVVAFLVAGLRSGGRLSHGVLSALGAYLLVLPIVWMTTHGWDVQQTLETAAVAVVVGGGASLIVGWARRAKSGRPARSAEEPARKGRGRASALSLGRKAA
jgi:hypothetical protein